MTAPAIDPVDATLQLDPRPTPRCGSDEGHKKMQKYSMRGGSWVAAGIIHHRATTPSRTFPHGLDMARFKVNLYLTKVFRLRRF